MLRKAAHIGTALLLLVSLVAGVAPRLAEPLCVRNGALVIAASPAARSGPVDEGTLSDTVPYQRVIRTLADRYGVPAELVESIIRLESNFNPQAVSARGAAGLMQLMPGTAAELGVHDIFDVEQNLEGGVRYLRGLLERFSGDVALAMAAYNAGSEVVKRYGGIPPYPETRRYVERVLTVYQGARERPSAVEQAGALPDEALRPDWHPAEPHPVQIAFTAVRGSGPGCG
jgi:soluble lytic murein transglycosylase-like protein